MKNKIPTEHEYKEAKACVDAYENELKRIHKIKIELLKKDLQEYFNNNLIDGEFRLKKFELDHMYRIIPIEPYIEEYYEGQNDEDIKKICEKHKLFYSMASWCYHK